MVEQSVINKIQALLRMAEHPNSNENEAALALERAQKLLFAHNLTQADIKEDGQPVTPGIGKIDGTEETGFSWKRSLLGQIAKSSMCTVIGSPHENAWHLFGTYDNVRSVLEMYHWIVPELESIALRAWNRYKADGTGRETARRWKTGFFMGASEIIGKRLRESLAQFEAGPGYAIIPYNAALVKQAVSKVYPHLRTSYSRVSSYDGRVAGRNAGQSMALRLQRKLSGVMALGSGR